MVDRVNGLVYLAVGGGEISNAERTRRYLELGLGPSRIAVASSSACSAIVAVEQGGVNAVSPAADPAPWYSAAYPESAQFLGLVVDRVEGLDAAIDLSTTDRLRVGAALGTTLRKARRVTVTGYLLATTCAGLEYGRAWLARALTATCDVSCGGTYARMRRVCPPGGFANTWGVRTAYQVALLDAPVVTAAAPEGCCDFAEVEFSLVFANPDTFADATQVLAPTTLQPAPTLADFCDWIQGQPAAVSALVTAPASGAAAAVVTITTGANAVNGVAVWVDQTLAPDAALLPGECVYPTAAAGAAASSPPSGECVGVARFGTVPPNTTLVVDGAQRGVYTVSNGVAVDASTLLDVSQGAPDWPVVPCGETARIMVAADAYCSGGDDATVKIETRTRE